MNSVVKDSAITAEIQKAIEKADQTGTGVDYDPFNYIDTKHPIVEIKGDPLCIGGDLFLVTVLPVQARANYWNKFAVSKFSSLVHRTIVGLILGDRVLFFKMPMALNQFIAITGKDCNAQSVSLAKSITKKNTLGQSELQGIVSEYNFLGFTTTEIEKWKSEEGEEVDDGDDGKKGKDGKEDEEGGEECSSIPINTGTVSVSPELIAQIISQSLEDDKIAKELSTKVYNREP